MFLMTGVDSYGVTQCTIEAITISDHAPVSLTLKLSPNNNLKYCRANVSILNNEVIQQQIRKVLLEYIQFNDNETVSPSVLWEGAKCVLRGNIIAISSRLKRERLAEQLGLENKIRQLEKEYQTVQNNDTLNMLKENRQ